jgi:broad specificity phosphatase PhoE
MPELMHRIYVIRHGETEWSAAGKHTSHTDIALTARGEDESRALAQRLPVVVFDAVLTSPRQRARQTCRIAGVLPQAIIEPDLAEWEYGDYEGRLSSDIRATRPGWTIFEDGCPGGESPEQVSIRADRVITRLRLLEGTVAVFTHGHFGRVLGARWIGLSVAYARRLLLDTASVSVLEYEYDQREQPVIAKWNG